jgi:chromosome segregation protein
VSKGLAAFGEEVDLQTELLEIKKSIKEMNKNLDNLRKRTDYSITSIEDKIKILEKIPGLEESFQTISEKLGPDNVQKLRKLIFSADELVDEVIPDLVGKKLRSKIGPAISEIKNLRHNIELVKSTINQLRAEIMNLQKVKDDVKNLEMEKERIYKEIIGRDAKFREGVDILKDNIKKRMDALSAEMSENLTLAQKANYEKIEKDIGRIFSDVIQLKLSEMDKGHGELSDRIKKLDLEKDGLEKKLEELKAPENVKKWVAAQLKAVHDETIPEIKSVRKEILQQMELIKLLRDKAKEFDAFSSDILKSEQAKKEAMDKLVSDRDEMAKSIAGLRSETSVLGEKMLLEKGRIAELENQLKTAEAELSDSLNDQKNVITEFRLEIGKMIDGSTKSLKGEIEAERKQDLDEHASSFRSELAKIKTLREETEQYRKKQEIRLDKMISDLKDIPPDIKTLASRISSLENMGKRLEGEKINELEFSSIVKIITKRIGEIEDHFDDIEDRIFKDKSRIEKTVSDLLSDDKIIRAAHDSIGRELEGKILNMSKSVSSDIQSLSQKLEKNSELISYLKERMQALDSLTKGIPRRIDVQETLLNKIVESKEFLVKRSEALAEELKSLTGSLSREAGRISALEQELRSGSKGHESRIDELSEELSSISSVVPGVKLLGESIRKLEAETRSLDKKLASFKPPESVKKWFNEKMQDLDAKLSKNINKLSDGFDESSEAILELRKRLSATESIARDSREHREQISKLSERMGVLDSLIKGLPKRLDTQEKLLERIAESKEFLSKRSEALGTEIKSLSGVLSSEKDRIMSLEQKVDLRDKSIESRMDKVLKNLTRAEDRLSEIDTIRARLEEIGALGKSINEKFIGESEFISTVKSISKRIDDIDNIYGRLDKEINIDKTRLQAAINQALSDEKVLKSAQHSLGKWLEENLGTLKKKLSADFEKVSAQLEDHGAAMSEFKPMASTIDSLSKKSAEHDDRISKLKERVHELSSVAKEVPVKFDAQAKELSDLIGSKGFLIKRTDSIESELSNLKENLDTDRERITGMEKELKSHSASQETRLDGVGSALADSQSKISAALSDIKAMREKIETLEKTGSMLEKRLMDDEILYNDMKNKFDQAIKKSTEEKTLLKEEFRKQGERVGRILKELR